MFRNIQLLRAGGAILVLLFHFHPVYRAAGGSNPLLVRLMPLGYVGVDLFFPISGFIMIHMISAREANSADVGHFLGRRFLRIFSWYLPCMALALALTAWYNPGGLAQVDLLRSATLTSVDLPHLALPVSWSLSYELYFYLAVALAWAASRGNLRRALWLTAVALVVWCWVAPYEEGTLLSFLTSPFCLEFLAGALLYLHRGQLVRKPLLPFYAVAALALLWLGVHHDATNGVLRISTFGAGAFFLLCLFVTLEETKLYRAGRIGTALGDASYSIYLLHLPALALFNGSGLRDVLTQAGMWLGEAGFIAYLCAFLAVCVALHHVAELPLYRWLCRLLLRWQVRPKPVAPTAA